MSEKYYSELNEIPLFNFEKCLHGDFSYIRLNSIWLNIARLFKLHKTIFWRKNEALAFMELYEKYIQKYSKKELERKVQLYKDLIQLQCLYVQTLDNSFLTQIDIKKAQLEATETRTGEKHDTTKTLVLLSKFMGYRLNPKEITVDEFYSIIQDYERSSKEKRPN